MFCEKGVGGYLVVMVLRGEGRGRECVGGFFL